MSTRWDFAFMFIACGLLACSSMLTRSDITGRPTPSEPTPVVFTGGAISGAGGGLYDGANTVMFDVNPGLPIAAKVHLSRYSAGGWSAPVPAIPNFEAWHVGGQVSSDGKHLYFESTRRDPAVPGREDTDLWVAQRVGDFWGNPRPIGPPFDTPFNEHGVTISSRATICINSNRRGITAGHDILCALRSGSGWEAPVPLDSAVNGSSADIAPFIDAEERFLLFASNRPGGNGAFDLYISVKRGGRWAPATPLGPAVNTVASESNPAVSTDGRRLLFSRSAAGRVVLHEVRFDPRWLD
jgi:hypothetical protein